MATTRWVSFVALKCWARLRLRLEGQPVMRQKASWGHLHYRLAGQCRAGYWGLRPGTYARRKYRLLDISSSYLSCKALFSPVFSLGGSVFVFSVHAGEGHVVERGSVLKRAAFPLLSLLIVAISVSQLEFQPRGTHTFNNTFRLKLIPFSFQIPSETHESFQGRANPSGTNPRRLSWDQQPSPSKALAPQSSRGPRRGASPGP